MTCDNQKRPKCEDIQLSEDHFGLYTNKTTGESSSVRKFTWRNTRTGVEVEVITYGATITSIKLPDKNGKVEDVALGFNDMDGYLHPLNPYMGATIGRVANRIGNAQFRIGDVFYNVTPNRGAYTLHGGLKGFDKVNWNYYVDKKTVIMTYLSVDLEEGFPGDLVVTATFGLSCEDEFLMKLEARTTKPTYVNMTNHSYFNLAGHNRGAEELYKHVVSINAEYITAVDKDSIPTGELLPVGGTVFDLRIPTTLGDVIDKVPGAPGFDHNFCISRGSKQTEKDETYIARVLHPESGRVLEVYSNQPGVQFYNGGFMPELSNDCISTGDMKSPETLPGKNGNYYKHGGFCLETQNYPDAINHSNFPKAILYPGEGYYHTIRYKFSVQK